MLTPTLLAAALMITSAAPSAADRAASSRIAAARHSIDVDALRARGQAGLDEIVKLAERDKQLLPLVDKVAAQHDAMHARLFWHTDLSRALAAAKREHKPVLSLRLLGRLDEELSCANSRFFRAPLYADPEVAAILREQFVLHWQMVRPVPVVTVDMGDGRSFKTTITGNSVHLVLDESGRPLDAIPGMSAPDAFAAALADARAIAACTTDACRRDRHIVKLARLDSNWARDMAALGRTSAPQATQPASDARPVAIAERAMAKAVGEVSVLRTIKAGGLVEPAADALASTYAEVGGLDLREVAFDDAALARFMRGRSPSYGARLRQEIATDTVQNEQRHHRAIHQWFAVRAPATASVDALQKRIYDEVFATPEDDAWLGLSEAADASVEMISGELQRGPAPQAPRSLGTPRAPRQRR